MASTISGAFNALRTNLEITNLQTTTTSTRQQRIRTAVEKDFYLAQSFLIGSYRRHTMIAPLKSADIDVFVVLTDNPHWPTYIRTPNQLLIDLKKTLKKTYPDTPSINPDGPSVTISFTDFKVDVVPAFIHDRGGYLIPDQNNRKWMRTDPTVHTDYISRANENNNSNLVPLIKMIKQWNRHQGNKFRSFYLELLAAEAFSIMNINNWKDSFAYFIGHAIRNYTNGVNDPAGLEGYINKYNKGDYNSCWTLLNNTAKVIEQAYNYEALGQTSLASEQWQRIFSNHYFPRII